MGECLACARHETRSRCRDQGLAGCVLRRRGTSACFGHKTVVSNLWCRRGARDRNRPANVPQRYANQEAHARYAQHAHTSFLGDFVSIENKERLSYFPKLDVAGSIPVARSTLLMQGRLGFAAGVP